MRTVSGEWARRQEDRKRRSSGFQVPPGTQPPYFAYVIIGLTLAGVGVFYATEGAQLRYRYIRDLYGPTTRAWFNPE